MVDDRQFLAVGPESELSFQTIHSRLRKGSESFQSIHDCSDHLQSHRNKFSENLFRYTTEVQLGAKTNSIEILRTTGEVTSSLGSRKPETIKIPRLKAEERKDAVRDRVSLLTLCGGEAAQEAASKGVKGLPPAHRDVPAKRTLPLAIDRPPPEEPDGGSDDGDGSSDGNRQQPPRRRKSSASEKDAHATRRGNRVTSSRGVRIVEENKSSESSADSEDDESSCSPKSPTPAHFFPRFFQLKDGERISSLGKQANFVASRVARPEKSWLLQKMKLCENEKSFRVMPTKAKAEAERAINRKLRARELEITHAKSCRDLMLKKGAHAGEEEPAVDYNKQLEKVERAKPPEKPKEEDENASQEQVKSILDDWGAREQSHDLLLDDNGIIRQKLQKSTELMHQ